MRHEVYIEENKSDSVQVVTKEIFNLIAGQDKEIADLKEQVKILEESNDFYAEGGNPRTDIWRESKLGYFTGKRARQAQQQLKELRSKEK